MKINFNSTFRLAHPSFHFGSAWVRTLSLYNDHHEWTQLTHLIWGERVYKKCCLELEGKKKRNNTYFFLFISSFCSGLWWKENIAKTICKMLKRKKNKYNRTTPSFLVNETKFFSLFFHRFFFHLSLSFHLQTKNINDPAVFFD